MLRIVQIGIVLLWLFSMSWLVKVMLTPDEAGMTKVDPRLPIDRFFLWNDNTRMAFLKDGAQLGEFTVSASSGEDDEMRSFSVTGNLSSQVETTFSGAFSRITCVFDKNLTLLQSDFNLRIPRNNLNVVAKTSGADKALSAAVSMQGLTLFSYNSRKDQAPDANTALNMLGPNRSMVEGLISQTGDPSQWKWQIDAYRGMHRIAERRMPIYLIKLSIEGMEQSLRLYLTESGEPLKMESDLGIQAISEVLVPIGPRGVKKMRRTASKLN